MNVVVTSTSADPEPVLEVEKSTDKQPYFRLNSELSSKKNGKKIAEKKGGYIEGHLELGSLGKDEVKSCHLLSITYCFNLPKFSICTLTIQPIYLHF